MIHPVNRSGLLKLANKRVFHGASLAKRPWRTQLISATQGALESLKRGTKFRCIKPSYWLIVSLFDG